MSKKRYPEELYDYICSQIGFDTEKQKELREAVRLFGKVCGIEFAESIIPKEHPQHIKESPLAFLGYEQCKIDICEKIKEENKGLHKFL